MNTGNMELYRQVADEAPVILWMTGPDGRHKYFNRLWREFTGIDEQYQLDGNAWLEALHPEDRENCLATIQTSFRDHLPMQLVYRLCDKDGDYHWMLDQSHPVHGADHEFNGYIGAVVDISEQKRIEEQLERMNYELERANHHGRLLRQMNDQIQICNDLSEVHGVVNHYASRLFSNTTGILYLVDDKGWLLEPAAIWGDPGANQKPLSQSDCWALRQGKPYRVSEKQSLACKHLEEPPAFGYSCTPLIANGDVIGLLYLQYVDAEQAGDDYLQELARNTAENLSLALSSFMLREALRYQSVHDPLTNLYNRRYMQESLTREIARAQRNDESLAVVMLDLDHFKRFNDTYGHVAGDGVLKSVSEYLLTNLRGSDIASRYGGEEFTLILPDINRDNAEARVEALRRGIGALETAGAADGEVMSLSMSAGLAMYPEHGETAEALLDRADKALYEAKESGRNRVCVARPS